MKIIIIEDEELTASDLSENIRKVDGTAEIVAILRSVRESVAYLRENIEPDLIFCDIQLGDGLSFEIFRECTVSAPVIFCTAFDEYALKAFKANGIDYILKPFSKNTIENALTRYNTLKSTFQKTTNPIENILELFENRKQTKPNTVLVYHKDNIIPVRVNDIALFYIENELTRLLTFSREHHTINKSLDELESSTDDNFFRANRQFLINRSAVKSASQYFNRRLNVSLTIPFDNKILVSKEKATQFLNWLCEK